MQKMLKLDQNLVLADVKPLLRDAVLMQTAQLSVFLIRRSFVQITEMLHGRHVALGALLGNVHFLHKL